MTAVNFKKIEEKWQKKWEDKKVFQAKANPKKKKFYVLEMFPYPSAYGLHMGHAFNYTIGDIFARYKRMKGFNVMYPMGYDALGLPAENAAIKAKIHPEDYTKKSIKNFIKQHKSIGLSYDWERMIVTSDPEYYKWDQWIFLQMFKKGLAYQKKSSVNWCPKCQTVLANEQVYNGKCWRHENTNVEIKPLKQWFFKITKYANELYNDIEKLKKWPEDIKAMQRHWIGKSHGVEIDFKIKEKTWPIFTTRPDTIYGVTFMVISAQHPDLMDIVTEKHKKNVEKFLKKIHSVSEKQKEELEKEGVFTGSYAENPVTGDRIPVYAGNFVVADYGCGMVMAVPAHDQRDFEFAKKYNIPIKVVIQPEMYELNAERMSRAYTGDGNLVNSKEFNATWNRDAIDEIAEYLEKRKIGRRVIQFKLRDWLISRQRYWGTPIPIIHCEKCGAVPVPEKELPIKLPKDIKFGKGNPLETSKSFANVKCPKCKGPAKRETDTMDTFVNSSWYFLRYTDPKNSKKIFDSKKANYWCPVDLYIGGREHACMHLIYFRFYTKFLRDQGLLKFSEPAIKLFNQGMLHGPDKRKMSKSWGNVILPETVSKKYGMDTARLFLISLASLDKDIEWSDKGIQGSKKLINRIIDFYSEFNPSKTSPRLESKINKTILEVSESIENFKYNISAIKIRELFEAIEDEKNLSKKHAEIFLKLLHPFCPHITEELWEKLGNKKFITIQNWPEADTKKINEKFEQQDKIFENTISDIAEISKIIKDKKKKEPKKVFIYAIPKDLEIFNEEKLSKKTGKKVKVFAVNDKKKYDPENKAKKAKPGRPAIYLE